MKYIFIGQGGLLIESGETKIMIDPYLSDYVKSVNPKNYRRVPVDESLFDIEPDFLLFTHNHIDHYDPETAPRFLSKERMMTVLAPTSVWNEARKCGGSHNYVAFDRGSEWTEKGIRFRAVKAVHSDAYAIGFVIEELSCGETVYVSGDTLYNNEILRELPEGLFAAFLPINGVGNNMNIEDAKRFGRETGAKWIVPVHFGMFDESDGSGFDLPNAKIPEIYKEIKF